ncbi:MAG: DNA polymerase III subunit delta' [Clostridiaceae bacterium]
MGFEGIIGHENIKKQLLSSIKENKLNHAHLISGEDGIGKSLLGKNLAIEILGKTLYKEYIDILEWRVSANKKSIGVEEIRLLIEEVNKKPYEGDKKVILIYEGEKMTVQAQNALLKTVEEPPIGIYIIILCDNIESILGTIKSRCQIHNLQRLSYDEMDKYLHKRYNNLSQEQIKTLISFTDGVPGRAEKYLEDENYIKIRENVLKIFYQVTSEESLDLLKNIPFLMENKLNYREVLTWFLSFIRDVLVYKETQDKSIIINKDKIEEIKGLASLFSFSKLNAIIKIIEHARINLYNNVNEAFTFQSMLLNMQEVFYG